MGMISDYNIGTPVAEFLRHLFFGNCGLVCIFFTPVSVYNNNIRHLFCLMYFGLKQGFILCEHKHNLGIRRKFKTVGLFCKTEIGNLNAVNFIDGYFEILVIEISACGNHTFFFPVINRGNKTAFALVKRVVCGNVKHIETRVNHFLTEFGRRIEHRVA